MHIEDPPSLWHLRLKGGSLVHLWADAYQEADGDYVFSVLARASEEFQAQVHVVADSPSDPEKVAVAVARIPIAAVVDLYTANTLDDPEWGQ